MTSFKSQLTEMADQYLKVTKLLGSACQFLLQSQRETIRTRVQRQNREEEAVGK